MKHSKVIDIIDNGLEVESVNKKTGKPEKKIVKVKVREIIRARGGLVYNLTHGTSKKAKVRSFRVGKNEITT